MIRNRPTCNVVGPGWRGTGRAGLTLIELLVAMVILIVSLTGLAAAWLFTAQISVRVDSRAAAYECARMVMERAHGFGYFAQTTNPVGGPVSPPDGADGTSMPAPGDTMTPAWSSPSLQQYRYFDASLNEVGTPSSQDGVASASPPPGTVYVATTTIAYPSAAFPAVAPTDQSGLPQFTRDDLMLMSVTVQVQQVNGDGSLGDVLISLQSLLTEGGL